MEDYSPEFGRKWDAEGLPKDMLPVGDEPLVDQPVGNLGFGSAEDQLREQGSTPRFTTKDSGARQDFDTGAKRDTQDGKPRFDLVPTYALARVADLYARGAEKYGDNNWQKGMPYSRVMASLERHLHQFKQREPTEDHLAAVVWNALAIMHYQEVGFNDQLDDLPDYTKHPTGYDPETIESK